MYFRKGLFTKLDEILRPVISRAFTTSEFAEYDALKESPDYIPYPELTEEVKEHDKKWARKVLEIIRDVD